MTQGSPEQQSASVVQFEPVFWQPAWQKKPASGLPVHGRPQQSADDAQAIPTLVDGSVQSIVFCAPQRGIPRLSWRQTSGCVCTVPAQQRSVSLQAVDASLQMSPAG